MTHCDMRRECTNTVTHIGEKGYVYCADHAPDRKGVERVRRMRVWELKLVLAGKQLPSYRLGPKPVEVQPCIPRSASPSPWIQSYWFNSSKEEL
jgi:hypothetical protein